ncbi:DNA polymerase-3 subunit epsilon [Novosphingobium sp. PhB57]|jgi:DNA polymerase-3 subunit epsilon|uniref:exonuclease domain-containing protein n=1 Tax=unclassified Novosphingobium TaxID=2644732 RepID=UPI0010EE7990|nr:MULTISPECIES: exonuclease domain-containing protein [unclassified Novosphingobium]TCU57350.1 DNA polymerase-3 subunit epsilon [Novosphingobium sp. PhB57]TDW67326.1 DNA polymerase-3 subunit epsilon [Novosphingobium sp. PhB55]
MKFPDSNPLPASASGPASDEPDFVVVDVETACARVSSICQIGIVGFRQGREVFAYETLVDPCDEFSTFNIRIHGISPEHVAGKPTFGDIHGLVAGHLTGRITVAHSGFDKGALSAACRIAELAAIETTWLDSVRVAKRAWPQLSSHRLNVLSRHLGIRHRHHDALSDARAAGMVIVRAMEETGIDLQGWMARPGKQGKAPAAAEAGPLKGQRIAILGEPRDGALAQFVAGAGGRVLTAVGATTTMLVISARQPYGRWVTADAQHRKAEELRSAGARIEILTEAELRARLAGA